MIEFSIAKQSAKEPGKEAAKRPGAGGLGIRTKLLLAFAGVAALTLLGSGVALVSYGHVNGAFERHRRRASGNHPIAPARARGG